MNQVMLVEDDAAVAAAVQAVLRGLGIAVEAFPSAELALEHAQEHVPRLVLLDVHLPGRTGIDLLPDLLALEPQPRVVVITALPTAEVAMDAMARGAVAMLAKPLEAARLRQVVEEALSAPDPGPSESPQAPRLVGSSPAMLDLGRRIGALARTEIPVLIRGESGTGKELVVRAIHERSARASQPLVAVSCAVLPEPLFEAELFGHERGAYTGAHQAQAGRVERAEGGTLFLDEVAELSAASQAKLLRFLEDRTYERVGGGGALRRADVRILAATNAPLEQRVDEGTFREDLYYRLDVASVHVPSLAARREDIPLLVEHFLARAGRAEVEVQPEALAELCARPWPGNLRELRNAIESALVALGVGQQLRAEHFPSAAPSLARVEDALARLVQERVAAHQEGQGGLWAGLKRELERELVAAALSATQGNQVAAARLLDLNRATLRRKMADYGLR